MNDMNDMNELYSIRMVGEPSLYHYGVLGMRWGVRKNRGTTSSSSSGAKHKIIKNLKYANYSRKKVKNMKAVRKALELDNNMDKIIAKKGVKKATNQYIKTATKGMRAADKLKDTKAFNTISSGRTYAAMLRDQNYMNTAIADAIKNSYKTVSTGKNYAYKISRDTKYGSVTITANGKANRYVYSDKSDAKYAKKNS